MSSRYTTGRIISAIIISAIIYINKKHIDLQHKTISFIKKTYFLTNYIYSVKMRYVIGILAVLPSVWMQDSLFTSDYDTLNLPVADGPVEIYIEFLITQIYEISSQGSFIMSTYFRQEWTDDRLQFNGTTPRTVDSSIAKRIWFWLCKKLLSDTLRDVFNFELVCNLDCNLDCNLTPEILN